MRASNTPENNVRFRTLGLERIPYVRVNVGGAGEAILENHPVILVVEDDQAVQNVIGDALEEGGFELAITASGEEAVTLLKGNRARYGALVADIGLRGRMTGWEVATHAREIVPGFPVLYITGAYAHQWSLRGVPHSALLTKPFAPAQLVSAIAHLLDTGSPPSDLAH